MTRKDFQLIADVLSAVLKAKENNPANRVVVEELAAAFASELAKTNPRFNKARFLKACTQ
ncbi:hypothetical protein CMI37_39450 [Candidatus Pacearchaeota archaeon]|nr:hypothetical protein [Candidatus Pacearchaeota archaeon]